MRWILIATLVVLIAVGAGHRSLYAQSDRPEVQFNVDGVGKVTLEPDYAILVFAIETVGTTAQGAIRENAARTEALLKYLREAAKTGDRIETGGFSVAPQRKGYVVINQVQLRTLQVKQIGALLDLAVRWGADDVWIGGFGRENTRQAAQQAVREAMQRARETAVAGASGMGMRIARVVLIQPSVEYLEGPLALNQRSTHAALRSSGTPVQPGLLTLTARVHMQFVLLP